MEIRKIPIEKLNPAAYNPRKGCAHPGNPKNRKQPNKNELSGEQDG